MLPVAPDAADPLLGVVDAADGRSVAFTSNIPAPASTSYAQDPPIPVNRLLHDAHVLITDRTDSHRLARRTAAKGGDAVA